jgi:hypothetical protein
VSNNSDLVYTIHNDLFNFWNGSQPGSVTVQQLIDALPCIVPSNVILDQHYFIANGTSGISPVWDSRATPEFQGVADAVFVGTVVADIPDPNPTQNVDWLHLVKVSGDIADEVYRVFTVGGVPPSSVSFLFHSAASQALSSLIPWTVVLTRSFFIYQCVSGTTEDISIKYVSQYWLFGGSLGPN